MSEQQPNTSEKLTGVSTRELLILSLGSGVIYILIALLLYQYFHDTPLGIVLFEGMPVWQQLGIGILFGMIAATIVGYISYQPPVAEIIRDFTIIDFVLNTRFTLFDRTQISLVAGISEEILFRGAIQPLMGVWWTSVLFVALHGYFLFKSPVHIMLGIMMFALSVGLGYLFIWSGLIAAIVAHIVYDFLLLEAVTRWGVPERRNLSISD